MGAPKQQSGLFQGIYEFEDPSGTLLAAKVPAQGSVDLYDGTTVVVRPNQCAMFIYKGEIADILVQGTHTLKTANIPVLTRLANWRAGFQSALRAELWFFSGNVFVARRWGTAHPVLASLDVGSVPIRGYGNYNVFIRDPRKLFKKLIGTRSHYDITQLEEFVQAQILEQLPRSLELITQVRDLNRKGREVGADLERRLGELLAPYGLGITGVQVLSLLPPREVLSALDAKLAMEVIGNPKEYLLYKAANSLDAVADGGSDPMQMMLGLMLGKGLIGADYHDRESLPGRSPSKVQCASCQNVAEAGSRFCPHCGREMK